MNFFLSRQAFIKHFIYLICCITLYCPYIAHAQYYNTTEKYLNANKTIGAYGGAYFFDILQHNNVNFWLNPRPIQNLVTETNYVVSDPANGQLMFYSLNYRSIEVDRYTAKTGLYNKNHELIENSEFIYKRDIAEMMHIAAITPTFADDYLFYIFYYTNADSSGTLFNLSYAVLDMKANNGLGKVIQKDQILRRNLDKQYQRGIIPGNDCNVWVLFLSEHDDKVYTYQIKQATLDTVPIASSVSLRMEFADADNPVFKIAPDRQTLFMTATLTNLASDTGVFYQEFNLMKFNIDDGTVSNQLKIPTKLVSSKIPFTNYEFIDHNNIIASFNSFTDTITKIFNIDITNYDADYILDSIKEMKFLNPTKRFIEFKKYKDYLYLLHPKFQRMNPNTMQLETFHGNIGGISFDQIQRQERMSMLDFLEKDIMPDLVNDPVYLNNNFLSCEIIYPLPYLANFTNKVTETSYCFQNDLLVPLTALRTSDTYEWDNGSTDATRIIDKPGVYWVKYPYKCIYLTDSFYINDVFEYLPVKDLDTTICMQQFPLTVNYPSVVDSVIYQGARVPNNRFYATENNLFPIELYKNGCVTDAKITVASENCPCDLFVANAFTPNADGLNDIFKPQLLNGCVPHDFELHIYNKYGTRVYVSFNNNDEGWDGTQNGKPLPFGVYLFEMRFVDHYTGKPFYYKGDITLIR